MTGLRVWSDAEYPPVAALPGIACADSDPEVFFPPAGGNQYAPRGAEAIRMVPEEI